MSIATEVFDTLSLAAANVYPISVPPGAKFPAVTYQRITTARARSHDGTSLVGPLFQVTCWDTSPTVARQTAEDIVEVWEPMLSHAQIENHRETYDPSQKLFGVSVDVRVWGHDETALL